MIYLFRNPETGEIKEVVQEVNADHHYSENGVKFDREFIVPNVGIDTSINPNSSKDFVEKTGKKSGSLNDLFQVSAELSEKRADQNGGIDPIKEEYHKIYAEKRGGKLHQDVGVKKAKEKLDKLGVTYE